jgi:hypothetical protein
MLKPEMLPAWCIYCQYLDSVVSSRINSVKHTSTFMKIEQNNFTVWHLSVYSIILRMFLQKHFRNARNEMK